MENNAQIVPSLLPEQRKDKKEENKIKTEDDKGRERIERHGVATLVETFRDFSGGQASGPLKTLAKQHFVINHLVECFSSSPSCSYFLISFPFACFLVRYSFSFVSVLSCKCNNNKWKEAAFTMPLIAFYLSQSETG